MKECVCVCECKSACVCVLVLVLVPRLELFKFAVPEEVGGAVGALRPRLRQARQGAPLPAARHLPIRKVKMEN